MIFFDGLNGRIIGSFEADEEGVYSKTSYYEFIR
jgi:hypothetical protein